MERRRSQSLPHRLTRLRALAVCAALVMASPCAEAITIDFNYSYDTSGFFTAQRQAVLQSAAQLFDSRLQDALTGIAPNGFNQWTAQFKNPSSATATASVSNMTVTAGHLTVFVGGYAQSGNTLAYAGPGGWSASGSQAFLDTVAARGQAGALAPTPTDLGPWGGAMSFNTGVSWYADPNPNTLESFPGQYDLYSVAVHELAHVLGFGASASWDALVSGNSFYGSNADSVYGGPVPLTSTDDAHWNDAVDPTLAGDMLTPAIAANQRGVFTALDAAALRDIGWQVAPVPEPATWLLMAVGLVSLARWSRKTPH